MAERRQCAIVTGGGQGLGRAFAHALARDFAIYVADVDGGKAARVAEEIDHVGGRAWGVETDVASEVSAASLVEAVERNFGAATVLVNNAAIFATLRVGPFTDITLDEWNQVQAVNVAGVFVMCKAIIPGMQAVNYGKIINISSSTVWTGRPNYLHYVTSKMALIGLTRSLASEVGPAGIRVNAVTPGSTRTEVERATISNTDRERMATETALRREQAPDDVVGAVRFLAGRDSDFITGQTINIDGGYAFH
jgi:3-oxoacyl-[acyl-carrier protein] reductase